MTDGAERLDEIRVRWAELRRGFEDFDWMDGEIRRLQTVNDGLIREIDATRDELHTTCAEVKQLRETEDLRLRQIDALVRVRHIVSTAPTAPPKKPTLPRPDVIGALVAVGAVLTAVLLFWW